MCSPAACSNSDRKAAWGFALSTVGTHCTTPGQSNLEIISYTLKNTMGEKVMKKSRLIVLLAANALLAVPLGLQAQEDAAAEPLPLSDVWMMAVKQGMDTEFAAAMAAHIQFRLDAGESRDWDAFRVAVGHNFGPVQYRACCFNWADLDAHETENVEKGLVADFNANVAPLVEHYHHYIERVDWENSHWPGSGTNGPYYGVTTWEQKIGSNPASDEAMKKMSQLAKNDGWANEDNNWLWLSRIGGKDQLLLVSSYVSYADMAPPEQSFFEFATEKLGEEEAAAMFSDFSSGFSGSDYTIWVRDETISTPERDE
jgi:hypothetical protein